MSIEDSWRALAWASGLCGLALWAAAAQGCGDGTGGLGALSLLSFLLCGAFASQARWGWCP